MLKFESSCIHCWEFYILRALINANKITINRVYKTTSYPGLLLLKECKMKHKHNYDACIQYLTSHSYVVFHQQRHWNIIDDQSFDCSIFVVLKACSIKFNKCHIITSSRIAIDFKSRFTLPLSRVIRYISNKTLSTSLNAASAKKASFMSNFSRWLVQCIAINHPRSTRNRVETPTIKNG